MGRKGVFVLNEQRGPCRARELGDRLRALDTSLLLPSLPSLGLGGEGGCLLDCLMQGPLLQEPEKMWCWRTAIVA